MDPDLLLYVCKHELPRRHRTKCPENVDALAIHKWAMAADKEELEAESDEGLAKLRKLKCTIGGGKGVREVQQLFIQVRKLRKLYRLKTSQRQIIKWLAIIQQDPSSFHYLKDQMAI